MKIELTSGINDKIQIKDIPIGQLFYGKIDDQCECRLFIKVFPMGSKPCIFSLTGANAEGKNQWSVNFEITDYKPLTIKISE
jgi:hypothetical protein